MRSKCKQNSSGVSSCLTLSFEISSGIPTLVGDGGNEVFGLDSRSRKVASRTLAIRGAKPASDNSRSWSGSLGNSSFIVRRSPPTRETTTSQWLTVSLSSGGVDITGFWAVSCRGRFRCLPLPSHCTGRIFSPAATTAAFVDGVAVVMMPRVTSDAGGAGRISVFIITARLNVAMGSAPVSEFPASSRLGYLKPAGSRAPDRAPLPAPGGQRARLRFSSPRHARQKLETADRLCLNCAIRVDVVQSRIVFN